MRFVKKVLASNDEEKRKSRNKQVIDTLKNKKPQGGGRPDIPFLSRQDIVKDWKEENTVKPKTLTDRALLAAVRKAWQKLADKFHIESSATESSEESISLSAYTPVSYIGTKGKGAPKFLHDEINETMFDESGDSDMSNNIWYTLGITKQEPFVVFVNAEISEVDPDSTDPEDSHISKKVSKGTDFPKNIEKAFDEIIGKLK